MPASGKRGLNMYVDYNAKSLGVQYNYAETRSESGKTTKTIDVKVDYQTISLSSEAVEASEHLNTKSLSGTSEKMLSGIKQSLAEIMDKIKDHTTKNYERQSETLLAEIKSFSMSIKISITTNDSEVETLKKLTAENGYFGVKQTSDRIFNFAAGVAGNDLEKLQSAKEGIEKGFEKVRGIFGANLPEITNRTHDAVMEKMDAYISEIEKLSEKAYA